MNQLTRNAAPDLGVAALRSVRRLTARKGRDAAGRFLVEGRQAVREALGAGVVQDVIVAEPEKHADLLADAGVPVHRASAEQMRQLSDTVTPQGLVAVCRQVPTSLDDLPAEARLVVICAQVRDPGNAGTVIRCADAFGADAVVLTTGSVELHNPKTVRSTVGSVFHLPIITGIPLADAVGHVRRQGMQVLAADGAGDELDLLAAAGGLERPTAWIMGNEAWGLPAEDAALADRSVAVPMWGDAESLNLSSAAAICLYQTASAQRRGQA